MRAVIRSMWSPDIEVPLEKWLPDPGTEHDFGFRLQLLVGPEGAPGEESFDVVVCTPEWLRRTHSADHVLSGRHHVIVFEYNFTRLEAFLIDTVESCTGATWNEVASKVSRFGAWEFEDYRPHSDS